MVDIRENLTPKNQDPRRETSDVNRRPYVFMRMDEWPVIGRLVRIDLKEFLEEQGTEIIGDPSEVSSFFSHQGHLR